MTAPDFYAPRRQIVRVLKTNARLHGLDILLGAFYVTMGFYLFRQHGASRVFEVIGPCLCLTGVMLHLTLHVFAPSARGTTRAFFSNLPQDQRLTWTAQLAFLLLIYLTLTAILFAGMQAGLASRGLLLQYHVAPDLLALPLYTVGATVWILYCRMGWGAYVRAGLIVAIPLAWFFLRIVVHERAETHNDFISSSRLSPLELWMMAVTLIVASAAMAWMAWRQQYQWKTGENR